MKRSRTHKHACAYKHMGWAINWTTALWCNEALNAMKLVRLDSQNKRLIDRILTSVFDSRFGDKCTWQRDWIRFWSEKNIALIITFQTMLQDRYHGDCVNAYRPHATSAIDEEDSDLVAHVFDWWVSWCHSDVRMRRCRVAWRCCCCCTALVRNWVNFCGNVQRRVEYDAPALVCVGQWLWCTM